MMNDTRLGKTLRKWVVIGLMLCAHPTWAKTEKATIGIVPFTVRDIKSMKQFNLEAKDSDTRQRALEKFLDIKNYLVRKVTPADADVYKQMASYSTGKSQRIVVKPMVEFLNDGKAPNYAISCELWFKGFSNAKNAKIDVFKDEDDEIIFVFRIMKRCELENLQTEEKFPLSEQPFSEAFGHSNSESNERAIEVINKELPYTLPTYEKLEGVVRFDLEDFSTEENVSYQDEGANTEEALLADGSNDSMLSFDMIRKSVFKPPLREFTLSVDKGRFVDIPAALGTTSEDGKSVTLRFNKKTRKGRKKYHFDYLYQTFDCATEGGKPHKRHGSKKDWYTVKFTLKLNDMLSKKTNLTLFTRKVELQCPPATHFTAEIKRTRKKHVLDAPSSVGGDLRNTPYMVNRITTLKSKQVMRFDFKKKNILIVPIEPFHNVIKDNEYFDAAPKTCVPQYDRRVTTKKLSRYHRLLRYDGHLTTDFKPKTPMRFSIDDKDMEFSVHDLKTGGFSYRQTETKQLQPEMEVWLPVYKAPDYLQKINPIIDIAIAFSAAEDGYCGAQEMIAYKDGMNNGFFLPRETETTDYDITVRRASEGEIKLFEKQKKKLYPRIFKKAPKKIVVDEERIKSYLPDTIKLMDKEKLSFEESMALFVTPILIMENFDQILMAVSRDAGLDQHAFDKLNNLTPKQKQAVLERIKKMTEADRREFMQQLSEADEAKRAEMLAPSGE